MPRPLSRLMRASAFARANLDQAPLRATFGAATENARSSADGGELALLRAALAALVVGAFSACLPCALAFADNVAVAPRGEAGAAGTERAETSLEGRTSEILGVGMLFQDVLKRWGPAAEKVEMEARRRNLWHYAQADVLFEEGRVISVALAGTAILAGVTSQGESSSKTEAGNPQVPQKEVGRAKLSGEASKVLTEILKSIPSNPDSQIDSPNVGAPLVPAPPGISPFMPSQMNPAMTLHGEDS